jgi:ABC-2 type transport system permease protein
LLQQYHAASLRDLPVDPIGIELLEEARDVEPVFDALSGSVYDAYEGQNRLYQAAGVLSPMLAIQSMSMMPAGPI